MTTSTPNKPPDAPKNGAADGSDVTPGQSGEASPKARFPWWQGLLLLLLSVALLVVGIVLFRAKAPNVPLVNMQWAGSAAATKAVIGHTAIALFRRGLYWDLGALIPGYTLGLIVAGFLGRRVFWTERMHKAARVAMWAALLAGLANVAQDVLLLIGLSQHPMTDNWVFRIAAATSFLKFSLLLVAAVIGLIALATTAGRLAWIPFAKQREAKWKSFAPAAAGKANPVVTPPEIEIGSGRQVAHHLAPDALWRQWWVPHSPEPATHSAQDSAWPVPMDGKVGICVSGGGIRSASVTLGALQRLNEANPSLLQNADYLVSVSGGGYTVGGMQVALHGAVEAAASAKAGQTGATAADIDKARVDAATAAVKNVFGAGSVEEDHLRRHSSYLADGAGQWLVALSVIFRCVLMGIVLLGLAIVTAGLAIGRFYREIPIIKNGLRPLVPAFLAPAKVVHVTTTSTISVAKKVINGTAVATAKINGKVVATATAKSNGNAIATTVTPTKVVQVKTVAATAPGWPGIPWGVTLAVLTAVALLVLAFVVRVSSAGRLERAATRAERIMAAVSGLLIVVGIAIPALVWFSGWVSFQVGFSKGTVITTGSLSVVVSYLGALAATLWRKRTTVANDVGALKSFFTKSAGGKVLPNSMVQMILLWICLLVLLLGALLLSGWVATSGLDNSPWALLPVGALLVLAIVVDETWFSLYPFYRRRLAGAFAVRRASVGGLPVAEPLGDTPTPLGTWGQKVNGFPEVLFGATANITGQDRTPPGRRAVSFMLNGQYVGGPQVGWVDTQQLYDLVGPCIQRDLEVEAAVAISGSAFAAAMGSQTRFFEVFLALTNMRLGAWLPNPYFVALKGKHYNDWTVPGLPSRRRLNHLVREIFNIHPSSARMLLCTDGGHYDNLGLMELLRHRCTTIYCFDASGGGAPLADTLAGTLQLAREELGVDIDMTQADGKKADPYVLVPGVDPKTLPAGFPDNLAKGMSQSAVIKGTITYPAIGTLSESTGTLIFAQATLTADLPYELLDYTQDDTGFPRDGTADQWFNCDQFDNYQRLGRYLAETIINPPPPPPGSGAQPPATTAAAGTAAAAPPALASSGSTASSSDGSGDPV